MQKRCMWAGENPLMITYHDEEWGMPVHDDRKLFEFLILEGVQAGLSWEIVLKKREHYRQVFADFEPEKIAQYTAVDQQRLLLDPGIIRNRLKISAAIVNAQAFLKVQKEFGSFDAYLWKFVNGKPMIHHHESMKDIASSTEISKALSKDLLRRGFHFVGPTICYAFMQAVGMVNDHHVDCFRYEDLR